MLGFDENYIKSDIENKEIKEIKEEINKIYSRLREELSYNGYEELNKLLRNNEKLIDLYMQGAYVHGYFNGVKMNK